jgi:allophanate hydrolase subunit 1
VFETAMLEIPVCWAEVFGPEIKTFWTPAPAVEEWTVMLFSPENWTVPVV